MLNFNLNEIYVKLLQRQNLHFECIATLFPFLLNIGAYDLFSYPMCRIFILSDRYSLRKEFLPGSFAIPERNEGTPPCVAYFCVIFVWRSLYVRLRFAWPMRAHCGGEVKSTRRLFSVRRKKQKNSGKQRK